MSKYIFHTVCILIFCFSQSKVTAQEDTLTGRYKIINVNDSSIIDNYFCLAREIETLDSVKLLFSKELFDKPLIDEVLNLKLKGNTDVPWEMEKAIVPCGQGFP